MSRLASLCKAQIGQTYLKISREAIQMHGGIGMTDEFDIGFFFKRAAICDLLLGDVNYHRNRYAELSGF